VAERPALQQGSAHDHLGTVAAPWLRTMKPDTFPDDLFAEWFRLSPTQAEVEAQAALDGQIAVKAEQADKLAAWRAAHPDATCSDAIAGLLVDLEERFAR
jgi:hypothetical protein